MIGTARYPHNIFSIFDLWVIENKMSSSFNYIL